MLDRKRFIDTMTGLCELYNKTPSEFIYDIYYEVLKDYTFEQVNHAITNCVRTHKYNTLPKPAEILEFLEGTKDDKALLSWLKVKGALDKADYYQSVEFDDPIISHCIDAFGGWMEFCETTALKKDLPFVEKRFMDLYRTFLKHEISDSTKLVGFIEAKNKEKGYYKNIPKPIQIGEDRKLIK